MADYGFDGMIKVSFVPTISNTASPTAVEINAGTPLEGVLTAEGLSISTDTATVDTSKLNSTAVSEIIGRDSFTISLTYVSGSHAEPTAAATALVRGASGYLVVRRNIVSTTAWTAAQKAEVYPVQCKRPNPVVSGPNTLQTVEVGLVVTDGTKVRGFDNLATLA